jgi:hypothetical protein
METQVLKIPLRPAVAEDFYEIRNGKKHYLYGITFWIKNSKEDRYMAFRFKSTPESLASFTRYFKKGMVYMPKTGFDSDITASL